jgi:NADH-quinone oxidoreductase subunit N
MNGLSYLADCAGIIPLIILFVSGLVILLMDAFSPQGKKGKLPHIALGGLILSFASLWQVAPSDEVLFGSMLYIDQYTIFFNGIFILGTILITLISIGNLHFDKINVGEYYALLLFSTTGMILLAQAAHLIMIFLGLEVLSLAVYILVGLPKHSFRANEASLKYFLLGAFASGFFLYGLTFVYGATGSLALENISQYILQSGLGSNTYLLIGMALVLAGFSFKMALVPFHMWTPDVYEGASTPVTAFMAVGVKAAIFAALVRFFWMAFPELQIKWLPMLWLLSVLTMTVGNLLALVQDNVKRMLAYSSIAHAGYILIAVVAGTDRGLTGMLFYILSYTFMTIGIFGVIILIQSRFGVGERVDDFQGLGFKYPLLGVVTAIFLFSLAGIPPTAGFAAKFYIFSAAVESQFIWLVILGVINSAIAVYYYLRLVIVFYSPVTVKSGQEEVSLKAPAFGICALVITAWATLQLGLFPGGILELAKNSIVSLS